MDRLLTPAELADVLGIELQTVYNRLSRGDPLPPAVKLGRLLRFPASGVDAWLKALPVLNHFNESPGFAQSEAVPHRHRGRPTKAKQIARRRGAQE